MTVVHVPDIEHPTLCYKQKLDPPYAMTRCVFKKGHEGAHSWDMPEDHFPKKKPHEYLSTACLHEQHELCRRNCKYCGAACNCYCHPAADQHSADISKDIA